MPLKINDHPPTSAHAHTNTQCMQYTSDILLYSNKNSVSNTELLKLFYTFCSYHESLRLLHDYHLINKKAPYFTSLQNPYVVHINSPIQPFFKPFSKFGKPNQHKCCSSSHSKLISSTFSDLITQISKLYYYFHFINKLFIMLHCLSDISLTITGSKIL